MMDLLLDTLHPTSASDAPSSTPSSPIGSESFKLQVILPLENRQYDFLVPLQFRTGFRPQSIAKICPWCLKTWAIIKARSSQFSVQGTCCLACWTPDRDKVLPSYARWPGSLLDDCGRMGTEWALLDHFPKALLEREFKAHLKVFS